MPTGTLLVSAGPTREHIDDVRFISNSSSGRMGMAIAEAALARGWQVHLALGPTPVPPPAGVELHPFTSARDLDAISKRLWPTVDAFVATAAVGDYRPEIRLAGKKKKREDRWRLELVLNPDILAERSREKGSRTLVGFALEAKPRREEALRKLVQKGLDLIILNSTANLGSSEGDFDWIEGSGKVEALTAVSKTDVAERIVTFLTEKMSRV